MGRLIPLIGAAIAALVIGGGAGWYFGIASAPKTVIVAEEKPHFVEYTIKDRIVNLADQGGRRYLKVSMVLQVAQTKSEKHAGPAGGELQFVVFEQPAGTIEAAGGGGGGGAPAAVEVPNAPQVHDAITTVLNSKRSEQIMTNEGRERLREELRARINTVMPAGTQVAKVYFTDFIIQ